MMVVVVAVDPYYFVRHTPVINLSPPIFNVKKIGFTIIYRKTALWKNPIVSAESCLLWIRISLDFMCIVSTPVLSGIIKDMRNLLTVHIELLSGLIPSDVPEINYEKGVT